MAHIDAALMSQIFDSSKGQWKPDVQHHRQADDLWTGFDVTQWTAFSHRAQLLSRSVWFKRVCLTVHPTRYPSTVQQMPPQQGTNVCLSAKPHANGE